MRKGLIKENAKDWKRGRSKIYSITDLGITSLSDEGLIDSLKILEKIILELKNPKTRKTFRNVLLKKMEKTKEASETIEEINFMSLPFNKLLAKIVELQLYLHSTSLFKGPFAEEPEHLVENNYFIFGPNMTLLTWWVPGTWPQIEEELKLDNLVKRATLKKSFETKG